MRSLTILLLLFSFAGTSLAVDTRGLPPDQAAWLLSRPDLALMETGAALWEALRKAELNDYQSAWQRCFSNPPWRGQVKLKAGCDQTRLAATHKQLRELQVALCSLVPDQPLDAMLDDFKTQHQGMVIYKNLKNRFVSAWHEHCLHDFSNPDPARVAWGYWNMEGACSKLGSIPGALALLRQAYPDRPEMSYQLELTYKRNRLEFCGCVAATRQGKCEARFPDGWEAVAAEHCGRDLLSQVALPRAELPPQVDRPADPPPATQLQEPGAMTLSLLAENGEELTVVPVGSGGKLKLRGTGPDGKPLARVQVRIQVSGSRMLKIGKGPTEHMYTNDQGEFETEIGAVTPRKYEEYVEMEEALAPASLTVSLLSREGSILAEARRDLPVNLVVLKARTVDATMKPRDTGFKPVLGPAQQVLAMETDEQGGFKVLAMRYHPNRFLRPPAQWHESKDKTGFTLTWPPESNLAMDLVIEPWEPGQVKELGDLDALTPAEHEARIKSIFREFLGSMTLKKEVRDRVLANLEALTFEYRPEGGQTYFDDRFSSSGKVVIGSEARTWWATLAAGNTYCIVIHELGHFLHHQFVETNRAGSPVYVNLVGLDHNTWSLPQADKWFLDTRRRLTAFTESAADLAAWLLFRHWGQAHPEQMKSKYFQRAYLEDFDDDEAAFKALADYDGSLVEGVQTRFYLALYGASAQTSPALVYSDYLATTLQYSDSWGNWEALVAPCPARSTDQWIRAKAGAPSRVGLTLKTDLDNIAARYEQVIADPPVAGSPPPGARFTISVNGETRRSEDHPVVELPMGKELIVVEGSIVIDMSTTETRRTLRLEQGARVKLRDRGLVEVIQGKTLVACQEGSVSIVTPTLHVKPKGTVYQVEVSDDGATRIDLLEGVAQLNPRTGDSLILEQGHRVEVPASGAPGPVAASEIPAPPAPEQPFEVQAQSSATSAPASPGLLPPEVLEKTREVRGKAAAAVKDVLQNVSLTRLGELLIAAGAAGLVLSLLIMFRGSRRKKGPGSGERRISRLNKGPSGEVPRRFRAPGGP